MFHLRQKIITRLLGLLPISLLATILAIQLRDAQSEPTLRVKDSMQCRIRQGTTWQQQKPIKNSMDFRHLP